MAKLPEKAVNILKGGHNVWIATIGEDGWPNVAIKGSGALIDDEHLYFADIFSKKTRANLLKNNKVAVGIYSKDTSMAVQVKGEATLLDEGRLFEFVSDKIRDHKPNLPAVAYVVQVRIDSVWEMSAGPNSGDQIA